MRAALIGIFGLLPTCVGAVAQIAATPQAVPSIEHMSEIAQKRSLEAAERQAAFDRLIGERGNRAIRSVCSGCGGTTGGRASVAPQARLRPAADRELAQEPGFDPSLAPID